MSSNEIREPVQKRSIEKKEKIIKAGFELICEKGYYNTNTAEIAKAAGVSTGIVYQYFKDKHDILVEGIKKYASDIFYPMLNITSNIKIDKNNLDKILRNMINAFIENHKLSQIAHEEIMSMTHSDKEIAEFFQENEMAMTKNISRILLDNGFDSKNLDEKGEYLKSHVDVIMYYPIYIQKKSIKSFLDIMLFSLYNSILSFILGINFQPIYFYSVLNAITGSFLLAIFAGIKPAIIVKNMLIRTNTTPALNGTAVTTLTPVTA